MMTIAIAAEQHVLTAQFTNECSRPLSVATDSSSFYYFGVTSTLSTIDILLLTRTVPVYLLCSRFSSFQVAATCICKALPRFPFVSINLTVFFVILQDHPCSMSSSLALPAGFLLITIALIHVWRTIA